MFFGVVGLSNFLSLGIVLIAVQDLQNRMAQWSENELNNYLLGLLGKLSKAPKLESTT